MSPLQTRQERRQKGKLVNTNVTTTYPSLTQHTKKKKKTYGISVTECEDEESFSPDQFRECESV